jgi:hypothetical protein
MCCGNQSAKTACSSGGFVNARVDAVFVNAFAQNPESLSKPSK